MKKLPFTGPKFKYQAVKFQQVARRAGMNLQNPRSENSRESVNSQEEPRMVANRESANPRISPESARNPRVGTEYSFLFCILIGCLGGEFELGSARNPPVRTEYNLEWFLKYSEIFAKSLANL